MYSFKDRFLIFILISSFVFFFFFLSLTNKHFTTHRKRVIPSKHASPHPWCIFVTFDLHRQNKIRVRFRETITFELNYHTSFSCFTAQISKNPSSGENQPLVSWFTIAWHIRYPDSGIEYTPLFSHFCKEKQWYVSKYIQYFRLQPRFWLFFVCQCNKLQYLNLKKWDFFLCLCFSVSSIWE